MKEILDKLLESEVFTDDNREKIREAFKQTLAEAKAEQEKQVRAELGERYEKDKKAIHAALEMFLEQQLQEHVAEFRSGIEEVENLKKQYADKTVAVKKEARNYVAKRLGAVEKVIEGVLKKELAELHESEKTNRRAYLNSITEKKAELSQMQDAFRQKAAAVLENIVNVQVQSTLDELREDIKAAREADFGREIFEAFMTTYRRQFFDSSKEFRSLVEELRKTKKALSESSKKSQKQIEEARQQAKAAEISKKKLHEAIVRKEAIGRMLEGLSGESREKMKTLLEATRTKDLRKTYKRFLPEVLNEGRKSTRQPERKRKLEEAVVELRDGGRQQITENKANQDDDDIDEIVQLAGLSKK